MKLLCDHMLGSLAKWLRILGIDTFYPDGTMIDEDIIRLAKKEHRLLISRDKALIARAKKEKVNTLELQVTDLAEQLKQTLNTISIDTGLMLTRCTVCNTLLESVDKNTVKNQVPPKVFETKDTFWYCTVCNKYYWMGTHYDNMIQKINELTQRK